MKNKSAFFLFLLWGSALLLWMTVIFFFSSLSGSAYPYEAPLLYYVERKGAHVLEYAVLMFFTARFIRLCFPRETFEKIIYLAAALSLTYGVSDEIHQLFVPYRQGRITDVLIDGVGVIVMAGMLVLAKKYSKSTSEEIQS